MCFALLFSVIDLINYCTSVCCRAFQSKPLVETENQVPCSCCPVWCSSHLMETRIDVTQVYLVVATAVTMGFLFGLVFGYLDVEDAQLSKMIVALQYERRSARFNNSRMTTVVLITARGGGGGCCCLASAIRSERCWAALARRSTSTCASRPTTRLTRSHKQFNACGRFCCSHGWWWWRRRVSDSRR